MSIVRSIAPQQAAFVVAAENETLESFLTTLRECSHEFVKARRLPDYIVDGLVRRGVYRALVPRRFGGDERSPREFCELIERIASADGSAGWVASFGVGTVYLGALPAATYAEIYRETPDVIFAGGIFPPQIAQRISGGFEVKGRWGFASGSTSASVIGVGIIPTGGDGNILPRMAVLPRSRIRIEENWNVVGLIGTGSHDVVVDGTVVQEDWTFVRGAQSILDEPVFRYPTLSFATQVLSVVALGIARGAIADLIGMAAGRVSITGAPGLADRPHTQLEIARCEAQLRSARAFFYEAIDDVWHRIERGDTATPEQISLLRLSSTHATRVGAEVTRNIQMLAGMTAIYTDHPLARRVCDSLVITQHAFMGDITYQNAGAVLFGKKPLPGYL